MTDFDYLELAKRIESHTISSDDIPSEMTILELQAWLNGYAAAVASCQKIVSEMSRAQAD